MLKIFKGFFRLFSLAGIIFLFLGGFSFPLQTRKDDKWIVIEKASKTLTLYQQGKEIASFPCSFGLNPLIPKSKKGDLATPEGLYKVRYKRPSRKYTSS
ncbi:MAG TPA: murein L,D-transpeptidase [Desulfobacterales bacterium]|nr:murein L,D-transpeptidase [Desulfobacterales bacterium]